MSRPRFDPYAVLRALDEERVSYVVIGGLARVLQGSDEITRGVDLTPSLRPKNLERLQTALEHVNARPRNGRPLDTTELERGQQRVLELESDAGEIKVVIEPEGTRGYDDLRHRADRLPIGEGLRPDVADPGDLLRMLEALDREHDRIVTETLQRAIEIDRGIGWER